MPEPEMTGGEVVAAALARLGVRHVFGIVSVHNLPIYAALSQRDDIEVVKVRHEQAAAHAADAYWRATGEMGVLLTSTGPGAANAVPGLYEAAFSSSAVLMVTGQAESRFYGKGKGFLHENEQQAPMLRTVCRQVASVRHPSQIAAALFHVAGDVCAGRPQPGAVEIPIDFQYASTAMPSDDPLVVERAAPDPALLDQAAERLRAARCPLIWAGGGVNSAGASDELTALAQRLGAPVLTTLEGRGSIPETHDLCLGPRSDRRELGDVISEADLLLAVGTRFQNYATKVWKLRLPDELIHIDVDPAVIGRNYPASLAVVGDARLALTGLCERLPIAAVTATDPAFAERARKHRDADTDALREEIGADHWEMCQAIRRLLPSNARIVRDATVPSYMWGNRLLPIVEPRTSIRAANLAIGPGVPLAIGAAVGSGAVTVVLQGDGGLLLSVGELSALAEHRLPVIVCVFNDRGYGVLRSIQDALWDERHGTEIGGVDFAGVAQAMGVASERVATAAEFAAAFERAVARAVGEPAADDAMPTLLDIDITRMAPIEFALPAHQRRRR